jgi:anti-sigma regulatory factor (Ser/Thr protein kinase)
MVDDAVLLTSDLATNAMLHGRFGIQVAVTVQDGLLRVEVTDSSPEMPVMATSEKPYGESGRGLQLVDSMAYKWGVVLHPQAKPYGSLSASPHRKAFDRPLLGASRH